MTSKSRISLALLWLGVLLLAGWLIGSRVELTGDLRKFMPARLSKRRARMTDAAPAAEERMVPTLLARLRWAAP